MKFFKNLTIGCFGLLVILISVAVILWRGGTGFEFLDSTINSQKRTIIAGQCVDRAKLPKAQCECMAKELATLPVSDVMSAIQSAQSTNPESKTGDIENQNAQPFDVIKNCASSERGAKSNI